MPAGGVMQAGGVMHASGNVPQPSQPLSAPGSFAAPPSAGPPGVAPPSAGHSRPPRAACDALVVQARLRLAEGDWRAAANLVGQAKGMNVPYSPQDDSPAKVEALIAQHRELDQLGQQTQQSRGDLSPVRQRQAQLLLEQAEALVKWNQFDAAERATRNAESLCRTYSQFERNPRAMHERIAQARRPAGVQQAIFHQTAPATPGRTWDRNVVPVQAQQPTQRFVLPPPPGAGGQGNMTAAMKLFLEGEQALQAQQIDRARQLYLQAAARMDELDPLTRDRLNGRLNIFGRGQLLDEAAQKALLLRKKTSADLATAQRAARTVQQNNPLGALKVLETAREQVTKAGLDPQSQQSLLARVDHDINLMKAYIEQNRGRIELDARNTEVKDARRREQQYNIQRQQMLARLVEQFNELMEQQRWAEADALVRQAQSLDPDNTEPVVRQLMVMNRLRQNLVTGEQIRDDSAKGFTDALASVGRSAEPFDDSRPRVFPSDWPALQRRRGAPRMDRRRSPKEVEIEQKLKTPVSLQFTKAPLHEVVDYLSRVTDVNMHLDPTGLAASGVEPNTPVTVNLQQDISLRSALQIILPPLRLSWVIKDEVLKITSSDLRDEEVYTVTYDVADLVIPIPNFAPSNQMGLGSAISEAYRQAQYMGAGAGQAPVVVAASNNGGLNGKLGDNVLANLAQAGPDQGLMARPGTGPGGLEGGNQPNFDTLIELIVTTIAPQSWEEVGGPGRIQRFPHNLSLVISQTQERHEEIADLLTQLRRLQDLQVTIEVRFISLNDNFFERIGVDFDFDIDDDIDRPFQVFGKDTVAANSGDATPLSARDLRDRDHNKDVTVGLSAPGVFSADLDIPFTQDSFTIATPQFGGFQPTAGASIGFAILSDIEAFFFIQASQGDQRSNVLQAPKVTLFNGQSAIVADITQSPFVISVVPVVGDFAAAYQPVIAVLSEGSFLSVQGVVSPDRRFVRMTVAPFFSTIGQVNTFSFDGSASQTSEESSETGSGTTQANIQRQSSSERTQAATTVQLPSFSFITVTTTVSVPDGGTVLLGGIKRLSEGRSEFGVPILSKVPYINRLFKNVAIGRETQSLLMMVTPRIIIQEEEEALIQ